MASTGRSGSVPALSSRLTLLPMKGTFGVTTDWHMLVIVALLKPDTATGCAASLPSRSLPTATLPYWTKS